MYKEQRREAEGMKVQVEQRVECLLGGERGASSMRRKMGCGGVGS